MTINLRVVRDNPGAHKRKKLVGRGIGSGKGKTSGHGGKGQTARSGVRLKGFQGGQTPLSRRLPKRGFVNIHRLHYVTVNLGQIQEAIDAGILDAKEEITVDAMKNAGFFKNSRNGVRLLAKGNITHKIHCVVSGVSQAARSLIENLDGQVTCTEG
jgi:large subunit ribosomal protein L15